MPLNGILDASNALGATNYFIPQVRKFDVVFWQL